MDHTTKVFLIGAIGALAPEIVRLYTLATGGEMPVFSPALYIPISILMAALGGLIAVILPSENLQSAFYTGIGTPTLINAAAKKVLDKQYPESMKAGSNVTKNVGVNKSVETAVPRPRVSRMGAFLKAL